MKKKIRRFTASFLSLLLLFSLFSCGSGDGAADHTDAENGPGTAPDPKETAPADGTGTAGDTQTAAPATAPDKELRVLFLGNSLIYYNDMPEIFGKLAAAAGKKIHVDSVTKGSATMTEFSVLSTDIGKSAHDKLTSEPWDYVIVEPSRRITPYEDTVKNAEFAAAKKLQADAAAAGAQLLLYSVWGNNDNNINTYQMTDAVEAKSVASRPISHQEHTGIMAEINRELAAQLGGVKTVDAGYAFENHIAADSSVNLYYTDNRHPSAAGSYLAACMFYGVIYGERTAALTFTNGLDASLASALRETADKTLFDGLIPDLTPPAAAEGDYNLLVIGSKLLDDYSMLTILGDIMKQADGRTLYSQMVLDGNFTFTQIAEAGNDLGVRSALDSRKWDAVVLQLSRRNTASSAAVAESETAALAKVMPLLLAETPDVFIMTLNSDANPAIFEVSNVLNYSKTSKKETYTAQEGTAYFTTLAKSMADKLGCRTILYGEAYIQMADRTKAKVGLTEACCLYHSLFGRPVPETCTVTNGLSAADAAACRALSATAVK